jgi:hypothetical protein
MRSRIAALFLLLGLALTPAWANDQATLHVSATILPRNTCALSVDASMRCSGTDQKVLYRLSRASASARPVLARATRGTTQALRAGKPGEILTIEF